jgi:translation initiation factor IF-2
MDLYGVELVGEVSEDLMTAPIPKPAPVSSAARAASAPGGTADGGGVSAAGGDDPAAAAAAAAGLGLMGAAGLGPAPGTAAAAAAAAVAAKRAAARAAGPYGPEDGSERLRRICTALDCGVRAEVGGRSSFAPPNPPPRAHQPAGPKQGGSGGGVGWVGGWGEEGVDYTGWEGWRWSGGDARRARLSDLFVGGGGGGGRSVRRCREKGVWGGGR